MQKSDMDRYGLIESPFPPEREIVHPLQSKVALSHSPNLQQQGEPHGPWTISFVAY
jgi:hypothetical protein